MVEGEYELYDALTPRELEILSLLTEKLSDREIAERLVVALTTVKWYNRQIFNKLGVENRREAITRAQTLGLLGEPAALPKHNLPTQTTPFVGRTHELADISRLLTDPGTRLVTILAPGGMGKTRFALAAAAGTRFADGAFFVPLAPLASPDQLIPTIAEYTGFQFAPDSRLPRQQLLDFLRHKTLLLVLDNFEHLLDGAPLVSDILQTAPGVKIVTTSRERLNLHGETVFALGGMAYPEQPDDADLLAYSAVQLFVQCARRAQPQFGLNGDSAIVARICQSVQGMPLAIELAAAWVGTLSPTEIADEITHSLDFLRTTMRDIPERLRSVRAVFESTWQRLTEEERSVFSRLSVFRGGCTRQAAQAVTQADVGTLTGLVNKALLWRNPESERYEIHELLRQYAEAYIATTPETQMNLLDLHCDYYANFAFQHGKILRSGDQKAAVDAIEADIENLRAAWRRAISQKNTQALDRLAESWLFYEIRGWWHEGKDYFGSAIEKLGNKESAALGRLLAGQSVFTRRLGIYHEAEEVSRRSIHILRSLGMELEAIVPIFSLGLVVWHLDGVDEAITLHQEALAIAQEYDDKWGITFALGRLGIMASEQGKYEEAREFLETSSSICREIGNKWGLTINSATLAAGAMDLGNYEEAKRLYQEALSVATEIGQQMMISGSLSGLGYVAQTEGNYDEAKHYLQESLRINREIGGQQAVVSDLTTLGEIACAQGTYPESRQYFQEALKDAGRMLGPRFSLNLLSGIAEWERKTGDRERAVELLSLVLHNPASEQPIKDEAARRLKEVEAELDVQVYSAAWQRGTSLELDTVVAELLAER